jgi:hypothetical protein
MPRPWPRPGNGLTVHHRVQATGFQPVTIRRLVEGKQIGIHHDFHYGLDLYRELS